MLKELFSDPVFFYGLIAFKTVAIALFAISMATRR